MRSAHSLILAAALLPFCATSHAEVVIGNWEGTPDGWIDWGTQNTIAEPKYTYSSDFGVTLGNQSLKLTQAGWNQNLSIKLQNQGLLGAFFANTQFSIDVTVPPSAEQGFAEIFTLSINAQGYGFVDQQPIPKHQFFFPNGGAQTATVTWEYGHLLNGQIPANAQWVEFIIATNSSTPHGVFYFDYARLVPEPASLATLALASGLLAWRRPRTPC